MAFDRNNTAVVPSVPVMTEEDAKRVVPADVGCFDTITDRGERLLYRLAQSELLHLTHQLTTLCREAVEGGGSDRTRLESLRHLSQRLNLAGTVLAELSTEIPAGAEPATRSLLQLIQELGHDMEGIARERQIAFSIDVAGAVRRNVPIIYEPLLRMMFVTAIRATATEGRIDVVTRLEGEIAAISATISSLSTSFSDLDGNILDLTILRNLAARHGGRLAIIQRHALGQQWVLRLPLGNERRDEPRSYQSETVGNSPLRPVIRQVQPELLLNEDVQSA